MPDLRSAIERNLRRLCQRNLGHEAFIREAVNLVLEQRAEEVELMGKLTRKPLTTRARVEELRAMQTKGANHG